MTTTFDPKSHAAEAAARQGELVQAEQNLAAAELRSAAALEALEVAEASLATITRDELAAARFEAEQAEAARSRADVAVTAARSSILNTDTSLAAALVPAIAAALPIGVTASVLPVELEIPKSVTEPIAVLSQLAPAQRDEESGEVWSHQPFNDHGESAIIHLSYVMRDRHRPLKSSSLIEQLDAFGIRVRGNYGIFDPLEARTLQVHDDLSVQTFEIKVYTDNH